MTGEGRGTEMREIGVILMESCCSPKNLGAIKLLILLGEDEDRRGSFCEVCKVFLDGSWGILL